MANINAAAAFGELFDSSDESGDEIDVDTELDRLLLLNETTCDINVRDTYLAKLNEFYKLDETMAVCCQTLGLANGIEMNYSFEKYGPFDLGKELKRMQLKPGGHKWSNVNEMLQSKAATIKNTLKDFPDEWTIIQLSREINPFSYCAKHVDIMRNNSPIYLSLLKYPHWEYNNWNPICIKIKAGRELNIFEDLLEFSAEYSKLLHELKDIVNDKASKAYTDLMNSLIGKINKLIRNMKIQLGPLVYLFQGQSKDRTNEGEFFKMLVKKFDRKLTKRQMILIYLLFTRTCNDMSDEILEIVGPIERTVLRKLNLFLHEFPQQIPTDGTCDHFPCIMIIDELLDQLPWEMILPTQEFTRIFSFGILEKLHTKYKSAIQNGYLVKKLLVGNWVINPDNDLPSMEQRMVVFSKYFRPDFKTLIRKVPTNDELKDMLQNCDVYIYSGHGSGLKYLRGKYLADMILNCIVFLFGCSSVGLNSFGLNNPMIGAHVYYHLAHCPTIVGNLYTVTDYKMDSTSAIILTRFMSLNNNGVDDFRKVNRKEWQAGKLVFNSNKKVGLEYNLAKLIASIRCEDGISITMRSAIVIRGLPVCNGL